MNTRFINNERKKDVAKYIITLCVCVAITAAHQTTAQGQENQNDKAAKVSDASSVKPFLEMSDLFENKKGGYSMYHIPGIAITSKGTVLAWCEARKSNSDWASIDLLLRRSTDHELTFDEPKMIGHIAGPHTRNPGFTEGKILTTSQPTYNNPVLIPDRNGTVHGLFCIEYYKAFYMRSDDDGVTWSQPVEITKTFEKFHQTYDWKVIATGPNHGIQLKNGRLVVPVWLSNSKINKHRPSVTAVIFSDDNGKTWQAGDVAVPCTEEWRDPNETVAVELSDGRVMLSVRNEDPLSRRLVTTSADGATGWSEPRFDETLKGAVCMAGLVRYPAKPDGGITRLLLSLPTGVKGMEAIGKPTAAGYTDKNMRRNLTVFISDNDGQTWPISRTLWPKGAAYSDLAVTADGTILCFFGRGLADTHTWAGDCLTLARFNLAWLMQPDDKPATKESSTPDSTK